MSRFGKWLGRMTIEVDGEQFDIKPTLGQKQRLMAVMQRARKGLTEADLLDQTAIFKEILTTSYPDEKPEAFDNFLLQNDMPFQLELYKAFGWTSEEDLKDIKEKAQKKVELSLEND